MISPYNTVNDPINKVRLLNGLTTRTGYYLVGNIYQFKSIDSTNQWMIRGINHDQITKGDVCIAEEQTAGKGRYGKHWVSPNNGSLYLSIVWRMNKTLIKKQYSSLLPITVGIELVEIFREYGLEDTFIKWPNDIILDDKKICGILVDQVPHGNFLYWVIGIGLNFGDRNELNCITNNQPGSVSDYVKNWRVAREQILTNTIDRILLVCNREISQVNKKIISNWNNVDYLRNKYINIRKYDGSTEKGIARGIDRDGALIVQHKKYLNKYYTGDVSVRVNESIND